MLSATDSSHVHILADSSSYAHGVSATILYFMLALAILILGFLVQHLLTPGNLRQQVFIDHLPNAAMVVAAQTLALGAVLVTAILTSEGTLVEGLTHVAVYSLVGLMLQTAFLVFLEAVIPGRFRDLVNDPKPRSSVAVVSVALVVVGLINAACLT